jgi:membrane-associated phospholipid phosphatase
LVQKSPLLAKYGDYGQVIIPIIAGVYELSKGNRKKVVRFVGIIIFNQMLLYAEKKLINKKRPDGRSGSFPSGHTSGAFLGIGFSIRSKNYQIALALFLPSVLVGVSRLVNDKHYLVDVLFGGMQGVSLGYLVA